MNTCEEVFSGRIDTPYHHNGPFSNERARYLAHLLKRGWARATVIGTACKLAAFAVRVDINCEGGVTVALLLGHYFNFSFPAKGVKNCVPPDRT